MDSEEIKLYLTNIEESLFDEKKIVSTAIGPFSVRSSIYSIIY